MTNSNFSINKTLGLNTIIFDKIQRPSFSLWNIIRRKPNENRYIYGIKAERGEKRITIVDTKALTILNYVRAFFGCGPLANVDCRITQVSRFLEMNWAEIDKSDDKIVEYVREIASRAILKGDFTLWKKCPYLLTSKDYFVKHQCFLSKALLTASISQRATFEAIYGNSHVEKVQKYPALEQQKFAYQLLVLPKEIQNVLFLHLERTGDFSQKKMFVKLILNIWKTSAFEEWNRVLPHINAIASRKDRVKVLGILKDFLKENGHLYHPKIILSLIEGFSCLNVNSYGRLQNFFYDDKENVDPVCKALAQYPSIQERAEAFAMLHTEIPFFYHLPIALLSLAEIPRLERKQNLIAAKKLYRAWPCPDDGSNEDYAKGLFNSLKVLRSFPEDLQRLILNLPLWSQRIGCEKVTSIMTFMSMPDIGKIPFTILKIILPLALEEDTFTAETIKTYYEVISLFPENKQLLVIDKAHQFISFLYKNSDVRHQLSKKPENFAAESAIEICALNLDNLNDIFYFVFIKQAPGHYERVLDTIKILRESPHKNSSRMFISVFNAFTKYQREQVIKGASATLRVIKSHYAFNEIFDAILEFNPESTELKSIINEVEKLRNYMVTKSCFNFIARFHARERYQVVNILIPLLDKSNNSREIFDFLLQTSWPLDTLDEVVSIACNIIKGSWCSFNIVSLCEAIFLSPEGEVRKDVLSKMIAFVDGSDDNSAIAKDLERIIHTLSFYPKQQRAFAASILILFKNLRYAPTRIDSVLPKDRFNWELISDIYNKIPESNWDLFVEKLSLWKGLISDELLFDLFQGLSTTLDETLSRKVMTLYSNEHWASFLILFAKQKEEHRPLFFKDLAILIDLAGEDVKQFIHIMSIIAQGYTKKGKSPVIYLEHKDYILRIPKALPSTLLAKAFQTMDKLTLYGLITFNEGICALLQAYQTGLFSREAKQILRDRIIIIMNAKNVPRTDLLEKRGSPVVKKLTSLFNNKNFSDFTLYLKESSYCLHKFILEQDPYFRDFLHLPSFNIPDVAAAEALIRIKTLYGIPLSEEEWKHSGALDIFFNLISLDSYLQNRMYADGKIIAGGKVFHVHIALLAQWSPFLDRAFTNGFKESKKKMIKLEDVSPETVESLLRYFYTGVKTGQDISELLAFLMVE